PSPAARHSMPRPDEPPIRAAGFLIAHREGGRARMLLLRNRHRGEWGFPKGHLENGEEPYAAAVRELAEETGIDDFELDPDFVEIRRYTLPAGKRAGSVKEVTYYMAIVKNPSVRLSREHGEYCWASESEARDKLTIQQLANLAA